MIETSGIARFSATFDAVHRNVLCRLYSDISYSRGRVTREQGALKFGLCTHTRESFTAADMITMMR